MLFILLVIGIKYRSVEYFNKIVWLCWIKNPKLQRATRPTNTGWIINCYIFLPISNVVRMFATGEGLLTQEDKVTPNGLQEVFATNLFGHFLLVSWWIRNECVSMTIHKNKLDVITNIDKSILFFQCYFHRSIAVVEHFTFFCLFHATLSNKLSSSKRSPGTIFHP